MHSNVVKIVFISFLVGIFLLPDVLNAGSTPLTLQDCVVTAIKNSPRILAAEDAVRKSEADIGLARSGFFPRISAYGTRKNIVGINSSGASNSDYDDQVDNTFGLQLTQNIFSGLSTVNGFQRALLAHDYAVVDKEDALARLSHDVQVVYYERLRALEDVKIHAAYLESLATSHNALVAMYEHNLITYSEILKNEVEMADSRQKLDEATSLVSSKTIELKGLMQHPFDGDVVLVGSSRNIDAIPELSLGQLRKEALLNNPAIMLAKLAVAVVQKDRDVALGGFLPKISLSLGYNNVDVAYSMQGETIYGTSYERDYSNTYGVGQVGVEWEFFSGGEDYYKVKRLRDEVSRLRNNLRDQETLTYTQLEKSFNSFIECRGRATQSLLFLKSARENLAMTKARMEKKLGTIPEVMLAQSQVQRAESTLKKNILECEIALVSLYYIIGDQKSLFVQ